MAVADSTVLIAVFADRRQAELATADLARAGFGPDNLGLVTRDLDAHATRTEGSPVQPAPDRTFDRPWVGAGLGALGGAGVAMLTLPLAGPVLAGGTLAILLGNAMAGGAVAGFLGSLVDWGIEDAEAHTYESELVAGRTLVSVHTGSRSAEALAILKRHGGQQFNAPFALRDKVTKPAR